MGVKHGSALAEPCLAAANASPGDRGQKRNAPRHAFASHGLGAGNSLFEGGEAADGNQVRILPHRLAEIVDGFLHRATGVTAGPAAQIEKRDLGCTALTGLCAALIIALDIASYLEAPVP